jgi:hypothetical protein|uniref:SGNH-hydrolase family esterase n=1 Tax=Podoviridae sp. ctaUh10 TaxID=2826563 RepID=A0A8S5QSG2_9CAUD|nr:MAG TPA: SGNH-hydrolase family esterase [Podoviridae sp. ctaUh10]
MATVYTKTDNYGLNLYGDNDPADLRDGYNNSMRTIDTTMEQHLNRIEGVEARETQTQAVMKALLVDNTVDNATESKSKWDKAAADVATATSKADNNSAILNALGADTTAHATASKTKWDKASSDAIEALADAAAATQKANAATQKANSNTAILAALGADTTAHATANKTKWDKASSDAIGANDAIARILKTFSRTNGHLVTFGDSYGTNADKTREWPTVLNVRLGENSILHNYCIAGAGYTAPNTTFQSELNKAKADTSYNHDEVGLVVIAGSRNTNDGYSGALRTAAVSLYEGVKREFPNARIIVVPMMWDWTPVSNYWRYNSASCISAAREVGVEAVPWAWTWNLGNNTYFPTGDIHPNADGTNVIVSYMLDYINHNYTGRTESYSWRDSTNTLALFTVNASGGLITFGWHLASNVTAANFVDIKNALPKWAERNKDTTNEPDAWSLMASNGANDATLFKVLGSDDHVSGTFGIQPYVTTGAHGSPNGLMGGGFTVAW